MKFMFSLLAAPLLVFADTPPPNQLYQANLFKAFKSGLNQEVLSVAEAAKMGNFGIGSEAKTDEVIVVYDSVYYKAQNDNTLEKMDPKEGISFAQLSFFQPTEHFDVKASATSKKLYMEILPYFKSRNIPYAVLVTGTFNYIKYDTSNDKTKPTAFEERNIKGSLVGYYIPKNLNALSSENFHFHFISQDRKKGGHVMEVGISQGLGAIAPLYMYTLQFPSTPEFATAKMGDNNDKGK